MGDFENIYKKLGSKYLDMNEPQEDMTRIIDLMKKWGVKRVLDLGCGTGRHTVLLAKAGFKVFGTEISKEGIRLTEKLLKEKNLKSELTEASCYDKFPFKDDFFDAVISTQVIHHGIIKDIRYCISEIERVLRPKGLIFISVAKSSFKKISTKSKQIAPRTYVLLDGEEKGIPHYVYSKSLIKKDFHNFNILDLHVDKKSHHCILGKLKEST